MYAPTNRLLRIYGVHRVTNMELFFDLVYVFAITQLSHLLLEHLEWHGAFQTVLLLLAMWWAWMYTTWAANWFDPDQTPVRVVLMGVMAASEVSFFLWRSWRSRSGERRLWLTGPGVIRFSGLTSCAFWPGSLLPACSGLPAV